MRVSPTVRAGGWLLLMVVTTVASCAGAAGLVVTHLGQPGFLAGWVAGALLFLLAPKVAELGNRRIDRLTEDAIPTPFCGWRGARFYLRTHPNRVVKVDGPRPTIVNALHMLLPQWRSEALDAGDYVLVRLIDAEAAALGLTPPDAGQVG